MRHFDFAPLYRHSVGFDRMANMLDNMLEVESRQPSYPPYNVEKTSDNAYRITLAIAGFTEADLDIESKENILVIKGAKGEAESQGQFLHRGIATRSFERRFQLADHVRVTAASLENGLLHIDLEREVPEALKPRKIEIASAKSAKKLTKA